ncbi:fasciclin domain-containing protein [Roseateles chitosanitabidus]|uniref:fasciclin domain-containing protein n=1 Tax=Roseateles chitosanitabidus TaxID=65048 RepID=UPI0008337E86|nr:fasciclin domain-containing protein [Roseateles chitosanitabidus]
MIRLFKWVLAAATVSTLLTGCGGDDDPTPTPTIAQAAQSGGFTALSAAATKAGLASTLADSSVSLTVFAPTNDAFAKLATQLGFASADAMITALPASTLASILQYHVLGMRKTAAELSAGGATQATLYKFDGSAAVLNLSFSGGVTVQDAALTMARVSTADVMASNGVIHAIDKVLVPPGLLNIVQMAQVNPLFDTLVGAVVKANLQTTLSGAGPFTVFAPTHDAFAAIATTVNGLSTQQLSDVLIYHVLGSQVLSANIPFGTPVTTVLGQSITINAGTPPTITDSTHTQAKIVAVDVRASNGVIHVIDKVLIPNPL